MGKVPPARKAAAPLGLGAPAQIAVPFGPAFFLTQLGAFVRDCCPTPAEGLPLVQLHLASGEVLDLCHVIALAPQWAALAVLEEGRSEGSRPMRTEIVPYELLVRITVRTGGPSGAHIGFHQDRPPVVHALPEQALATAARHAAASSPALRGHRH